MRFVKLVIATSLLLLAAGAASAADWTTSDGGSTVCTALQTDGVCWQSAIAADSSAINVRQCNKVSIVVYGTGADIMPQACTDDTCSTAEPLLAAASTLTGDAPNTFVVLTAMLSDWLNLDWTSGGAAPTVSIKCAR